MVKRNIHSLCMAILFVLLSACDRNPFSFIPEWLPSLRASTTLSTSLAGSWQGEFEVQQLRMVTVPPSATRAKVSLLCLQYCGSGDTAEIRKLAIFDPVSLQLKAQFTQNRVEIGVPALGATVDHLVWGTQRIDPISFQQASPIGNNAYLSLNSSSNAGDYYFIPSLSSRNLYLLGPGEQNLQLRMLSIEEQHFESGTNQTDVSKTMNTWAAILQDISLESSGAVNILFTAGEHPVRLRYSTISELEEALLHVEAASLYELTDSGRIEGLTSPSWGTRVYGPEVLNPLECSFILYGSDLIVQRHNNTPYLRYYRMTYNTTGIDTSLDADPDSICCTDKSRESWFFLDPNTQQLARRATWW